MPSKESVNDDFPTKGNPRSANFPLMKSFYSALNRPYQSLELMLSVSENDTINLSSITPDTISVPL